MTILKSNYKEEISRITKEIKDLYQENDIPWIIGYSGGKDSTVVLQLIWVAISQLPKKQQKKPIHIITTDTLVENPIVSSWVDNSLSILNRKSSVEGLPFQAHKLTPEINETFWVNLIGKGYPAPRNQFRWCTDRLKIKPVTKFVKELSGGTNEAIIVLGTRKAESTARAGRINKNYHNKKITDLLSPHNTLQGSYIYAPIVHWSNDDVWLLLMQNENPWGCSNKDLLSLYSGATDGGECPLVTDTTTPSCGDSRFGCWVCTLVDKDKSMTAMITNDNEKEWLEPLLHLRNELDEHDHDKRDYRRLNGSVNLKKNNEELVPGPYTQSSREAWLKKLLSIQSVINSNEDTPEEIKGMKLISDDELNEIRRIWVVEKFEIEDNLPKIFEEILKKPFPHKIKDSGQPFKTEEMSILKNDVCKGDDVQFSTLRELIEIERRYRSQAKRNGLSERLTKAIKKGFFRDHDDALEYVLNKKNLSDPLEQLRDKTISQDDFLEIVEKTQKSL